MTKTEVLEVFKTFEQRLRSLEIYFNNLVEWDLKTRIEDLSNLWDDFNYYYCKLEEEGIDE